jgi:diguanylate cyclase (GGDEF)-like protein
MSEDDLNILEHVISMTRERDKRSLESSFIEILSGMLGFEMAMLLKVSHGNNDWTLEVLSYYARGSEDSSTYARPKIVVPMDDLIRASIEQQQAISESRQSSTRRIYPVIVNHAVKALLMVYARDMSDAADQVARSFVQIYSNFMAVLDDNERDTLTGLFNRKAFDSHISELLDDAERKLDNELPDVERRSAGQDAHRWLGILDIDHFKSVNDTYGHLYGDEVLMIFANIMQQSFRKSDLLFRYGGEEFVVILTPASEKDAMKVFNRFRERLESYNVPQVGRVTVSIGIARLTPNAHPATVLENADQSLYYAKENGRNRVANYHELIDQGILKPRSIVDEIELF